MHGLMYFVLTLCIDVSFEYVPARSKVVSSPTLSSDITSDLLTWCNVSVVKYVWGPSLHAAVTCDIKFPYKDDTDLQYAADFYFIPLICTSLYDASYGVCNVVRSTLRPLNVSIPDFPAFDKFCKDSRKVLSRSNYLNKTKKWMEQYNKNIQDEAQCVRVCIAGDRINPLCKGIFLLNTVLEKYSGTLQGGVNHNAQEEELHVPHAVVVSATKVENSRSHSVDQAIPENSSNHIHASHLTQDDGNNVKKSHPPLNKPSTNDQKPKEVSFSSVLNGGQEGEINLESLGGSVQEVGGEKLPSTDHEKVPSYTISQRAGKDHIKPVVLNDALVRNIGIGTSKKSNDVKDGLVENMDVKKTMNSGKLAHGPISIELIQTTQHSDISTSPHNVQLSQNESIPQSVQSPNNKQMVSSVLVPDNESESQSQVLPNVPVRSYIPVIAAREGKPSLPIENKKSRDELESEPELPPSTRVPENVVKTQQTDLSVEADISNPATVDSEPQNTAQNDLGDEMYSETDRGEGGGGDDDDVGGETVQNEEDNVEDNLPPKSKSVSKGAKENLPPKSKTVSNVIQDNLPPKSKSVSKGIFPIDGVPEESNAEFVKAEDSHFFAYFMTMIVLCIIGYLVFHNKQKILALALEGRSRRGNRRRPSTSGYRKLDSNLEEAVTSQCSSASVTHVIY